MWFCQIETPVMLASGQSPQGLRRKVDGLLPEKESIEEDNELKSCIIHSFNIEQESQTLFAGQLGATKM